MEHLDRSSLEPTGSHRQGLGLQRREKWMWGAPNQWNHNLGLHRSQRRRFVPCLSLLCSSWGAPVGWAHTLSFGNLDPLPALWGRHGDRFLSCPPRFPDERPSGFAQGRSRLCVCVCVVWEGDQEERGGESMHFPGVHYSTQGQTSPLLVWTKPSAAQPAHILGFILEKRAFVSQFTEVHKQPWWDDLYLLTGQEAECPEHSGPRQLRHRLGLQLLLGFPQLTIFFVITAVPFPSHVSDLFTTLEIFYSMEISGLFSAQNLVYHSVIHSQEFIVLF